MSAITRSGGSIPSIVSNRCSGRRASSFPRMKRSTPHSRIVAMPTGDDSTVAREYQRGLSLARSGEWFEAHEAFELDFFQGLVHVVVSAYQAGRGREVAATRQREKGLRRLAPFRPAHRGLDVDRVTAALQRAETDFRQHLVECRVEPPAAVEE